MALILLQTIAVAFSMFSAVPMPIFPWNERNMRYMLCALPLVGAVIGFLCWGWQAVCGIFSLPALLRGAGLCLIPAAVTGGIHLDGFADTSDALASRSEPDRMQEILRDPHLGAFAAIRLMMHFLASFALWVSLPRFSPAPVILLFCLSRALGGFATASFPLAKNTGLAHAFAAAADRERVRVILAAVSAALAAAMVFTGGWLMALAAAGVFVYFRHMTRARFGGLSGDLAGWFITVSELAMLAALSVTQFGGDWWCSL